MSLESKNFVESYIGWTTYDLKIVKKWDISHSIEAVFEWLS